MTPSASARAALLVSASILGFLALRRDAFEVASALSSPADWLRRTGVDGAAATLAAASLWCLSTLVLAAVLVSLLARMPGTAGIACARLSELAVPAVVRRLVGLGVGLTFAVGTVPLAHATALPGTADGGSSTTPRSGTLSSTEPLRSLPAPLPPARDVTQLAAPPALPRSPRPGYQVRSGDSLWSIAERVEPGAPAGRIVQVWRAWYAANRTVIGADPGRLRPGQVLQSPGAGSDGAGR